MLLCKRVKASKIVRVLLQNKNHQLENLRRINLNHNVITNTTHQKNRGWEILFGRNHRTTASLDGLAMAVPIAE